MCCDYSGKVKGFFLIILELWLAYCKALIYLIVFSFADSQHIDHHNVIFDGIHQTIAYSTQFDFIGIWMT